MLRFEPTFIGDHVSDLSSQDSFNMGILSSVNTLPRPSIIDVSLNRNRSKITANRLILRSVFSNQ